MQKIRLRKKGTPKQGHYIPEIEYRPYQDRQAKRENYLIRRIDHERVQRIAKATA